MAQPTEEQHADYMRRAIALSREGAIVEKAGGCFGAIVVDATGAVIGEGYNCVVRSSDPTAHGEVVALRAACAKAGSPHLPGATVYTSAQPCPMCYAACLWARVGRIYYAATYADVKELGQFDDADFLAEMNAPAAEKTVLVEQLLRDEALVPWKEYAAMEDRVHY